MNQHQGFKKFTSIEIQRNNVTPADFFAYIKAQMKNKGTAPFSDMDLEEFLNPQNGGSSTSYHVRVDEISGKKVKVYDFNGHKQLADGEDAPCRAEVCRNLPCDYQSYCLHWNGECYNEIVEFNFDDDKRGSGYYHQFERNV